MKKIIYNNETFEADKIVKNESNIIGYNKENVVLFSFNGISDFEVFKVFNEDGSEGVFDNAEPSITDLQTIIFNLTTQLVNGGVI